ncbi:MAG: beta-ketoacyl-[acyl-carrier-protein] synthase family protein [Thermodesulfobacteriota bacterium]
MHRVAMSGMGIVSSLGLGCDAVAGSLRRGRSGVALDPQRLDLGFSSALTGVIRDFTPSPLLTRKQRKTMPEFALWAHAAVAEALEMAGLAPADVANERTGLVFGSDSSCLAPLELVETVRARGLTQRIPSGMVFQGMTSTVTLNLNAVLGVRGASWTVSAACASSAHALGQAADLIALGRQDRVICGGAQEITWQSMAGFDGIGAFSSRMDAPAKASRPFDAGRDGLVPSGGAAALVLERLDLARDRGARVFGEVLAYDFSSDGASLSLPSREGLARAMAGALARAGLAPGDVDYVCAHATSTPAGDAAEAEAIAQVFAGHAPAVSSLKSMSGHELWMSGASQAVSCALMARDGFIAPNLNLEAPDPAAAGLNLARETLPHPPRLAMCNAAGFGGTNACLLLGFAT